MGLLRNRGNDEGDGSRYQMREKLLSVGDDYWIEDDEGNRAFTSTARRSECARRS